jgi:hypothetical protein
MEIKASPTITSVSQGGESKMESSFGGAETHGEVIGERAEILGSLEESTI